MAGIDILDLVEATEVNETNDYLAIVDKSDTSQDITGSTKRATVRKLLGDKALPSGDFVGTTDTQTLTNKTISLSNNTISGLLDFFYPVGTIYETTSSDLDTVAKMNAHFGGTWEFYGAGRVLVAKSADTEFDTVGKTGGQKITTHGYIVTPINIGKFQGAGSTYLNAVRTQLDTYLQNGGSSSVTTRTSIQNVGGSVYDTGTIPTEVTNDTYTAPNLQPYITVYRYRRIS